MLYLVIASDRGLCGSFNTNIAKFTELEVANKKSTYEKMDFIFVGRRIRDYFARRDISPIELPHQA